jgi:GDP-fucose transporter C1
MTLNDVPRYSVFTLGSLSIIGVLYGILASLFVALNAIYTKKTLPIVNDSIWFADPFSIIISFRTFNRRMTMYNNLNGCFLFLPLMFFAGEFSEVIASPYLISPSFWLVMGISGIFGFIMGYVTGWQIQVTSALTHNISGTAKAAAQTVLAVIYWHELKPFLWWLSNVNFSF